MFLLVVSLLCWLPATAFSSGYNSDELSRRIKTGRYLQKTDNLMIIVDGTGDQSWLGFETQQVKIGKKLIDHIGRTIPNIPHRRMLRVFGPTADSFQEEYSTIFGLFNIDARDYTPIVATKTHGISDNDPLELTFYSAIDDLHKIDGTHAIILISRGDQFTKAAIAESAYLKKAFGGSICFYPIYIGNTPKGEARMQQFKRIGGCGTISTYADVDTPEEMTNFVESVFFAKKRNLTPAKDVKAEETATVPEEPAADDITAQTDEPYEPELVGDVEDQTVAEENGDDIIIIERQLPHDKVVTIELHVEFDLNKATVKDAFKADIQNVADFMKQYPETEVLLEGHTCSLGTAEYNMALSKKRAKAVQNCLVKNFGIAPERVKTRGAGETEPIADNATEEGRVKNRRVMAVISTIVTDVIIIEQEISREEFLSDDFVLPPIEDSLQEQIQPTEDEELTSDDETESEVLTDDAGKTEETATEETEVKEVVVETEDVTETKSADKETVTSETTTETITEKVDAKEKELVVEAEDVTETKSADDEAVTSETTTEAITEKVDAKEKEVVVETEEVTETKVSDEETSAPTTASTVEITTEKIELPEQEKPETVAAPDAGDATFNNTEEKPLTVPEEN
jgi:OOP family OmpA-OmpF porin